MTERLHFHFSLSCIGEGNGNPLQCSCLENPRDRGAWWAAIYRVAQSRTRLKWLSSSSKLQELCREIILIPEAFILVSFRMKLEQAIVSVLITKQLNSFFSSQISIVCISCFLNLLTEFIDLFWKGQTTYIASFCFSGKTWGPLLTLVLEFHPVSLVHWRVANYFYNFVIFIIMWSFKLENV